MFLIITICGNEHFMVEKIQLDPSFIKEIVVVIIGTG
jgi:hypothetical protein